MDGRMMFATGIREERWSAINKLDPVSSGTEVEKANK